jgi:hypothetical protein
MKKLWFHPFLWKIQGCWNVDTSGTKATHYPLCALITIETNLLPLGDMIFGKLCGAVEFHPY